MIGSTIQSVNNFLWNMYYPKYKSRDADNQFAFTISNLGYQFVEELINEHFVDQEFTKSCPRNIWEPLSSTMYITLILPIGTALTHY